MSTGISARTPGVEGAGGPSRAGREDRGVSQVSDGPTARSGRYREQSGRSRRGSPHLDTRMDGSTLAEVRARAHRLGLSPSAWVRAVVRDALDVRRADELDAALAAARLDAEDTVQAHADARELAAQVRPLAVNINDLDRRARAGEPVSLGGMGTELVELLREVRELLGDRVAS